MCVCVLPFLGGGELQYPHVVIDYRSSVVLVALATLGAVVHMLATVMAVRSTSLVLQARELGSWVQCAAPDAKAASVAVWVPGKVYRRGEVVAHKHSHYKAQSDTNTADPTHLPSSILHVRPATSVCPPPSCGLWYTVAHPSTVASSSSASLSLRLPS